jgi:hypothetical protein
MMSIFFADKKSAVLHPLFMLIPLFDFAQNIQTHTHTPKEIRYIFFSGMNTYPCSKKLLDLAVKMEQYFYLN